MFGTMPSIRSAVVIPAGPSFPVTDQLVGLWDPEIDVTGTAPITVWADQSGSGNDWLEDTGSGGAGPTLSSAVLNGLAVVTFDGTNDKMNQSGFISGSSDGEMFCVCRRTTTANKGWHTFGTPLSQSHMMFGNVMYEGFGSTNRANAVSHGGTLDLNEWAVYNVSKGTNLSFRTNNVSRYNALHTTIWNATFYLGSGNNGGAVGATNGWQGQIAGMAMWDKELSGAERTSVFDHFNDKFALGL